jgi:hypothetical protein
MQRIVITVLLTLLLFCNSSNLVEPEFQKLAIIIASRNNTNIGTIYNITTPSIPNEVPRIFINDTLLAPQVLFGAISWQYISNANPAHIPYLIQYNSKTISSEFIFPVQIDSLFCNGVHIRNNSDRFNDTIIESSSLKFSWKPAQPYGYRITSTATYKDTINDSFYSSNVVDSIVFDSNFIISNLQIPSRILEFISFNVLPLLREKDKLNSEANISSTNMAIYYDLTPRSYNSVSIVRNSDVP